MKKRVYISGKMTGEPDLNRRKFKVAEDLLLANGFHPINPHKLPIDKRISQCTWEDYMRNDIKALCDCEAIALLDDWNESRGAILEVSIALELRLEVMSAHTLELHSDLNAIKIHTFMKEMYIIAEMERELKMRNNVYPGLVINSKITQEIATHRINIIKYCLQFFKDRKLKSKESQPSLFS